jgi:hypothetical protein
MARPFVSREAVLFYSITNVSMQIRNQFADSGAYNGAPDFAAVFLFAFHAG